MCWSSTGELLAACQYEGLECLVPVQSLEPMACYIVVMVELKIFIYD